MPLNLPTKIIDPNKRQKRNQRLIVLSASDEYVTPQMLKYLLTTGMVIDTYNIIKDGV